MTDCTEIVSPYIPEGQKRTYGISSLNIRWDLRQMSHTTQDDTITQTDWELPLDCLLIRRLRGCDVTSNDTARISKKRKTEEKRHLDSFSPFIRISVVAEILLDGLNSELLQVIFNRTDCTLLEGLPQIYRIIGAVSYYHQDHYYPAIEINRDEDHDEEANLIWIYGKHFSNAGIWFRQYDQTGTEIFSIQAKTVESNDKNLIISSIPDYCKITNTEKSTIKSPIEMSITVELNENRSSIATPFYYVPCAVPSTDLPISHNMSKESTNTNTVQHKLIPAKTDEVVESLTNRQNTDNNWIIDEM